MALKVYQLISSSIEQQLQMLFKNSISTLKRQRKNSEVEALEVVVVKMHLPSEELSYWSNAWPWKKVPVKTKG
jgi:hypothetical protein